MKKSLVMAVILVLSMALAACGKESNSAGKPDADFPKKPITLIVPWSAGGGTDTGARLLQPYLEDELGVTVNVVNKTGGGGWVGWNELANAKPDGYTIGLANSPHIITGYMNPALKRDKNLDDFIGLGMHVIDPDILAIRKDEKRFSTTEELVEYAKDHKLTVTATGEGTDEHLVILSFNKKYGTQFEAVHFDGAAESRAAVLGGHVDILIANAGEVLSLYKDKEIKVLGVASSKRSQFMEDVPTFEESGFEIYQESSRGLIAPKGLDSEVLAKLQEALEKAVNNEEHIQKMADLGYGVNYENGDDYMTVLKKDEEAVIDLKGLLGWE
ncbi:hypothetical protein SLU01_01830 [Sporosarcina luteola]|uniref:Tripartite tricarboxylate transporter substrate binding protein n=1 Tax=Sporosarcina luteola TaxID=582850 RepID=A0A511Z355_9BACL|nr:tripartite tricarboxylate transporter substrate binding protein [Sporosarcina luteola]GEN81871.1 hypothetical protein SLU01_01830 [Sporosarcina luteola]